MSSPEDEYPPLCQISRAPSGYFQPDPVVPWLGLEYDGQCGWQRLESPETGVRAEFGLRPNRGDGGGYGVQIHYMGARFFDRHNSSEESLPAEQGRMIGAVLAPHHGRLPEEANFYCACDSIDEDITQVARVLLDQYSVEELFGCGSLLVVVEHEFAEGWMEARQEAALRLVIDHLAQRWKRLRRVAIQVTPPSFNREALPTDQPRLQLRYREALAAELARLQGFNLSPACLRDGKICRHSDLLFSIDRRFDFDESIVELLRQTGKLPQRSQLLPERPMRGKLRG
jgi:hypothetical protein